jgi:hypothetical protein
LQKLEVSTPFIQAPILYFKSSSFVAIARLVTRRRVLYYNRRITKTRSFTTEPLISLLQTLVLILQVFLVYYSILSIPLLKKFFLYCKSCCLYCASLFSSGKDDIASLDSFAAEVQSSLQVLTPSSQKITPSLQERISLPQQPDPSEHQRMPSLEKPTGPFLYYRRVLLYQRGAALYYKAPAFFAPLHCRCRSLFYKRTLPHYRSPLLCFKTKATFLRKGAIPSRASASCFSPDAIPIIRKDYCKAQ